MDIWAPRIRTGPQNMEDWPGDNANTASVQACNYIKDLGKGNADGDLYDMDAEVELSLKIASSNIRSRYKTGHFVKASQIIRALTYPMRKLRRPHFIDDAERILTYELTISILKYETFLNQALEASGFVRSHPLYTKPDNEDVLVIMFDLLERDFRVNTPDPNLSQHLKYLQHLVLEFRTKIMAHMARLRIKHEASSLEILLPDNLRKQKIDQNPLYAWINLKKIKKDEILLLLEERGFFRSEIEDDILIREDYFYVDENFPDLLRFHSGKKEFLSSTKLVRDKYLVIQDKSVCLPIYTIIRAIFYKDLMLQTGLPSPSFLISSLSSRSTISNDSEYDWYDKIIDSGKRQPKTDCVVITHAGSGRSVAHLASLLQESIPKWLTQKDHSKASFDLVSSLTNRYVARPTLSVVAFGVPQQKRDDVNQFFKKANLLNVKLYPEDFSTISPKDPKVRGACAIVVNPPSSGSALKDPVSYVCSEGGDEDVLIYMGKFMKNQTASSSTQGLNQDNSFTPNQDVYLKHAFRFRTKLILYTTCSILEEENQMIVNDALNEVREAIQEHKSKAYKEIIKKKQIRSIRDVAFETVDLNQILKSYPKSYFKNSFLQIPPTSASSGCFMALIRRKEKIFTVGRKSLVSMAQMKEHIFELGEDSSLYDDNQNFPSYISKNINKCCSNVNPNDCHCQGKLNLKIRDFPGDFIEKYNHDAVQRRSSEGSSRQSSNSGYYAPYYKSKSRPSTKSRSRSHSHSRVKTRLDVLDNFSFCPSRVVKKKHGPTKKEILNRVSTPTYASLTRKKEKVVAKDLSSRSPFKINNGLEVELPFCAICCRRSCNHGPNPNANHQHSHPHPHHHK